MSKQGNSNMQRQGSTASDSSKSDAIFENGTPGNNVEASSEMTEEDCNEFQNGHGKEDDRAKKDYMAKTGYLAKKNDVVNGHPAVSNKVRRAGKKNKAGAASTVSEEADAARVDAGADVTGQAEKLDAILKLLAQEKAKAAGQATNAGDEVDGYANAPQYGMVDAILKLFPHTNEGSESKASESVGEMADEGEEEVSRVDTAGKTNGAKSYSKKAKKESSPPDAKIDAEIDVEINTDIVCGPCEPCAAHATRTTARLASLETQRKALKVSLAKLKGEPVPDDISDAEAKPNVPAPKRKKGRAGKHRKNKRAAASAGEGMDELELEAKIEAVEESIGDCRQDGRVEELRCSARRYRAYVHEQGARWLRVDGGAAGVKHHVKFKEFKAVMEILGAEAEKCEVLAAEIEGEGQPEGKCDCGQPVPGILMAVLSVLLAVWVLESVSWD